MILGIDRFGSNDSNYDLESGRLKKLSSFQAKLLRHALNEFNMAKRIVYSTCSLYPQENEEVIKDVLQNHKGKFRLVSVKEKLNSKWNNMGDFNYVDIGEKCIYARPNSDLTIGFFVAVLEQMDTTDMDVDVSIKKKKKLKIDDSVVAKYDNTNISQKKKSKNFNTVDVCDNVDENTLNDRNYDLDEYNESQHAHNGKTKKKKKSKNNELSEKRETDIENHHNDDSKMEENINEDPSTKKKKKKKKKKMDISLEDNCVFSDQLISTENDVDVISDSKTHKKKHKRKNKHEFEDNDSAVVEIESDIKISKKKRCKTEISDCNESNSIIDSADLTIKKKKKK